MFTRNRVAIIQPRNQIVKRDVDLIDRFMSHVAQQPRPSDEPFDLCPHHLQIGTVDVTAHVFRNG
ncbi:MAG: hypothetical protein NVS2B17_14190 [Candidatus Velthaea sp.]